MFVAHAPAGYLCARGVFGARGDRAVVVGCVVGALVPDVDLLRFWWEHGQTHHHRYWTHLPAAWLAIAAVVLSLLRLAQRRRTRVAAAFFVGVASHLLLDTVCGDIAWLWPLSDRFFHLVTVAPTRSHWILSFVLHPVSLLEIALVAAAVVVRQRARRAGDRERRARASSSAALSA